MQDVNSRQALPRILLGIWKKTTRSVVMLHVHHVEKSLLLLNWKATMRSALINGGKKGLQKKSGSTKFVRHVENISITINLIKLI